MFLFGSSLTDFLFSFFSMVWLIAVSTIILFCYYFLKDVASDNLLIQISLKGVIIFTVIIIFLRIPLSGVQIIYNSAYMIFDLSRFLIVLLFFVFLINFYISLNEDYGILKLLSLILIFGFGISAMFGLIFNYHYINFLITGNVSDPLDALAPIANIAGLVTLITEFFFLFQFRKINDYKNLLMK
jgi:hypothetical protein